MAEFPSLSVESRDPDRGIMHRAYQAWAPFYDPVCSGLFEPSRRRLVALASMAGRDVLEIGIGTGLSLGDYDSDMVVTGIDASDAMIARAKSRADAGMRARIAELAVMDAEALGFPARRFDAVVAQFLITLVPNPEKVLNEAYRVLRPGGALFLLNHFRSQNRALAALETCAAPLMHHLGLRPDFPFERVTDWAAGKPDLSNILRIPSGPFDCFSIVRIGKDG
jgi:phosphatidylethanolamine/phosphatidyl-N-methylethanolamine N-methyltransferase